MDIIPCKFVSYVLYVCNITIKDQKETVVVGEMYTQKSYTDKFVGG